jgi:DNA repair protein RecN (Recombination protein N)
MLAELTIQSFALIDKVNVQFGPGFNVLTGETGAGKSIVIDAINGILGERMGSDVIRTGSGRATIEAVFDLSGSPARLREVLDLGAVEADEASLLLSREIATSGRNQCRVSGRLAPVSMLREVARNLVDVHGQHEHQSLLSPDRHLDILDQWCGQPALDLRRQCSELDDHRRELARELARLGSDDREKARRLDLLRFQAGENDAAGLEPGEEEGLLEERRRLANVERLMDQVGQAYRLLNADDADSPAALHFLESAVRCVDDSIENDRLLAPVGESLRSAMVLMQDAVQELSAYQGNLETNPARLDEVEERLALVRQLKRKYGETIDEILAYRAQIAVDMEQVECSEERKAGLAVDLAAVAGRLQESAALLSRVRQEGAARLEEGVASEMADLALAGAQFGVSFQSLEPSASGADKVEFMLSANPGEPPRPLARIASGGEMSRIMLAIKSLLTSSVSVPTVIFDEIDVGIGGRIGEAIGEKLAALGQTAQVICVTHLPQVAAAASRHFCVRKEVSDGRTMVSVWELCWEERIEELSRMLGGGPDTARRHARDMLARQNSPRQGRSQAALLELQA